MLVDGKLIATGILESVAKKVSTLSHAPRLTAVTCAPNFETQKYLKMKKAKASSVGVVLNVVELPEEATTQEVILCVMQVAKVSDGVVIQLPLPPRIDRDAVLATVAPSKDPDGFQYGVVDGVVFTPVVGAIDEISKYYHVDWSGKKVVVLGEGRLVGKPAAYYARQRGADVQVMVKETFDAAVLKTADIIVSGAGQAKLITADSIKEGVVVFDAGTSEDGGVLVGDAAPDVASKASLLTPVPGGIGPITIAYLLRNLVQLARQ